jgi:7,8-dihydropterin-6-yl-methyl-4-(beta-D-ribofuranosyl)aminobenzene 5'-phosphate synthase
LTGVDKIHAFIGGMHLTGGLFEPIIPATIAAMAEIGPDVVVPGHCSGWRAIHALAARLPDQFIQSNLGTRFHFAGASSAA